MVHLLNVNYDRDSDRVGPRMNVLVQIPARLVRRRFTKAKLHAYDAKTVTLEVERVRGELIVRVPEIEIWSILEFL